MVKISHRVISMEVISDIFKNGMRGCFIIENAVWEGAYLLHSYIDHERRILHLFYHDPINGEELPEGQDILLTTIKDTVFKVKEEVTC